MLPTLRAWRVRSLVSFFLVDLDISPPKAFDHPQGFSFAFGLKNSVLEFPSEGESGFKCFHFAMWLGCSRSAAAIAASIAERVSDDADALYARLHESLSVFSSVFFCLGVMVLGACGLVMRDELRPWLFRR